MNMIGADPEVFLKRMDSGKQVPVYGLIGGTKENPIPIPGIDVHGYAMQEDGAALEFNIPASDSAIMFSQCINHAMRRIATVINKKGLALDLSSSSITLEPSYLADPRAHVIGCQPDFSAYHDTQNWIQRIPPTPEILGATRYAGGHIHLSYNKDKMPPWVAARYLDCYLALPNVESDNQKERRKFYGQPGIFREKSYGVEYRTMSNWWLRNDGFTRRVGIQALEFIDDVEENLDRLHTCFGRIPWDEVQKAVLHEDAKLAGMLVDQLKGWGLNIH